MKSKSQNWLCFIMIGFLVIIQTVYAGSKDDMIKEMIKTSDVSLEFYGKVIDQYWQPVVDAKVVMNYQNYNPAAFYSLGVTDVECPTDFEGNFALKDKNGSSVFIDSIEKKGYEWRRNSSTVRSFDYRKKIDESKMFKPDKNNPVVFQLYKKPEPGLLIDNGISGRVSEKELQFNINLLEGFKFPVDVQYNRKWQTDFNLTVKKDVKKDNFILELKFQTDNGSFVLNNNEPYIAPVEGYLPSITLILKPKDSLDANYYCKFPKGVFGTVYARLKLKVGVGATEMSLKADLYTNIEGKRNLEYDRDFTVEEMSKFAGHTVEYNSDEYRQLIPEILMRSKTISTTTTSI